MFRTTGISSSCLEIAPLLPLPLFPLDRQISHTLKGTTMISTSGYSYGGGGGDAAGASAHAASPPSGAESVSTRATGMTRRSTLLSVIRGVGELNVESQMEETERAAQPPKLMEPYMIVDLRDPEEFEQCHIRGGEFSSCIQVHCP